MTTDELQTLKPGQTLMYFLGVTGTPYGYRHHNAITVKYHCVSDTGRRVKCEFLTADGNTIHRWLSPSNLSIAQWSGHDVIKGSR